MSERNEAAERLREHYGHHTTCGCDFYADLDAALAAERSAGAAPHDPMHDARDCPECDHHLALLAHECSAGAVPIDVDPYDMRVMVRGLYASGLTDDMNPSDRRKAALRLRDAFTDWRARLLDATPSPSADDADDMCPNCVTPWKCNGPHELPSR